MPGSVFPCALTVVLGLVNEEGYFIQNFKSEILKKTLNPKWNFTVEMPVTLATTVTNCLTTL